MQKVSIILFPVLNNLADCVAKMSLAYSRHSRGIVSTTRYEPSLFSTPTPSDRSSGIMFTGLSMGHANQRNLVKQRCRCGNYSICKTQESLFIVLQPNGPRHLRAQYQCLKAKPPNPMVKIPLGAVQIFQARIHCFQAVAQPL